jgi:hypothetical protein
MDEEEPEGIRMATGGLPEQEWELPTGLILEKDSQYGVDLYVDYITVKILKGGRQLEIDESMAKLLDYRELQDMEKQALKYEIESLLESEAVPQKERNDEGKMVKLTKEERRSKAEDLAEESENLEYGSEVLEPLKRDIDDEQIPYMFRKQVWAFWADEGAQGPSRGTRPENEIAWLSPEEEEFLNTVQKSSRRTVTEDEVPQTRRSFALAVREIMERLSRQDFVGTFRRVIPVWSYMRLKYDLKKKDTKYTMMKEDFREANERLELMRHWLRSHKLEMADAARRMLDKKETAGISPKAVKKGAKQLTVEMKKAKMMPRTNPETCTEKLLEYYNALGQDPEVPIDWLIGEGATPDEIWAAADELLKTGRIDPPDYWAITATLSGVDYHVVVPRGNPAANEELAQSKKLEKAAREKHGSLPDKVDKLFRQMKVRFKGKSDSELLDMAKEQLGVKKRRNPSFKNAREALKDALKRLTTIEVVEYKAYEPPEPEPTTEESMESLEQTAEGLVEEEKGIEEGVKALESLTSQTIKDDWTAMFDRERKEHPTLSEDVVKRIVDDHLAFKKGLNALRPDAETGERENPSVEDRATKAFWEKKVILGPKAIPMDEQMPRRKGEPPQKAEERRDEVRIYGEPGLADDREVVAYYLWGNLIARLATNEQDHETLSLSSAGFETNLTNQRLHSILSEGQKRHPILKRFSISKERHAIWLERIRTLKEPDPKKPWQTHKYDKICAVAPTMYPLDEVKGKLPAYTTSIDLEATLKENLDALTGKPLKQQIAEMEIPIDTLEEVQTAIDAIEKSIAAYRAEKKDFDATPVQVAEWLGTRQKYEELLKQRDELMWRGNPKRKDIISTINKMVGDRDEQGRALDGTGVTGDCANFAEALQRLIGGEIWCVFESIYRADEGEPAHCAVKVDGEYWDADARPKTGAEIIRWANIEDLSAPSTPCGWSEEDIIFEKTESPEQYGQIRDESRIAELMTRAEGCENPKIPYTPPDAPDVEVKCPITGKYTWSCTRCALFDGRSEQFIECKAKEGKKYYLARTGDKRGTVWDTYILPRSQRKAGIETRAIGGD